MIKSYLNKTKVFIKKSTGFELVSAMLVLALFGVFMATAIPMFKDWQLTERFSVVGARTAQIMSAMRDYTLSNAETLPVGTTLYTDVLWLQKVGCGAGTASREFLPCGFPTSLPFNMTYSFQVKKVLNTVETTITVGPPIVDGKARQDYASVIKRVAEIASGSVAAGTSNSAQSAIMSYSVSATPFNVTGKVSFQINDACAPENSLKFDPLTNTDYLCTAGLWQSRCLAEGAIKRITAGIPAVTTEQVCTAGIWVTKCTNEGARRINPAIPGSREMCVNGVWINDQNSGSFNSAFMDTTTWKKWDGTQRCSNTIYTTLSGCGGPSAGAITNCMRIQNGVLQISGNNGVSWTNGATGDLTTKTYNVSAWTFHGRLGKTQCSLDPAGTSTTVIPLTPSR